MDASSGPFRLRDPLRGYQFTVGVYTNAQWKIVGGVQRVSGLSATVAPLEVWEGGNNLHRYANPDKVTWDPVTLEQGLALDDTLDVWANAVRMFVMNPAVPPVLPVKRKVSIEVWEPANLPRKGNAAKKPARKYTLFNAWISKYVALPKMDALASEILLGSVELIHEGFTVELPS